MRASSRRSSARPRGMRTDVSDLTSTPASDERVLALRGWTGEYLQARVLGESDVRLWHADGRYLGALVPRDATADLLEGVVYGADGSYLANAARGRLSIDVARRRAARPASGGPVSFASPGDIEPTERRWPRREQPQPPRPTT